MSLVIGKATSEPPVLWQFFIAREKFRVSFNDAKVVCCSKGLLGLNQDGDEECERREVSKVMGTKNRKYISIGNSEPTHDMSIPTKGSE